MIRHRLIFPPQNCPSFVAREVLVFEIAIAKIRPALFLGIPPELGFYLKVTVGSSSERVSISQ